MNTKDVLLYFSSIFWITSNLNLFWEHLTTTNGVVNVVTPVPVSSSLPSSSMLETLEEPNHSSLRGSVTSGGGGSSSSAPVIPPEFTVKPPKNDATAKDMAVLHAATKTSSRTATTKKRVLVGLFTSDTPKEMEYRRRHRALFQLWNDERVCTLDEYQKWVLDDDDISETYQCEVIYTFVIGGNPNAPSQVLVDDSRPILVDEHERDVNHQHHSDDITDENVNDITLLNIRENMNEGKSQTFLYYASLVMQKSNNNNNDHNIDYVMKCDTDSMLHLHKLLAFIDSDRLPPSPYNKNILVGALRNKSFWPTYESGNHDKEQFWHDEYQNVHLYAAGQNYILSQDLATYIGQVEAKRLVDERGSTSSSNSSSSGQSKSMTSYLEGHEDHDISSMAFHSKRPIQMIIIGQRQRFWEHPVKGTRRWERIWQREQCRMNGTPFEGKMLKTVYNFD